MTENKAAQAALDNAEETVQRIREFNEKLIESTKASGRVALESYEKALKNMLEFQRSMAGSSQIEWVNTVASTQVQFVQDISEAYTRAARDLIK